MIHGLQRFVAELRDAGIRASTAEWLDALRAIEVLGIEDREQVRAALAATLVKRAAQRPRYDALFDRFFAPPGRAPRKGRGHSRRAARGEGRSGEQTEGSSAAPPRSGAAAPLRARSQAAPPRDVRRPDGKLLTALRALREGERTRRGRLRQVIAAPVAAPDKPIAGSAPLRPPRRSPRTTRSAADSVDAATAREVRRAVERLRLRTARRRRRAASGRPFLRRLFRESLHTGGVPFRLPRARRRRRRARLTLLVDVSWSAARASGLFLEMAGEFVRFERDARVLCFVDRPVDATRQVAQWSLEKHREPFARLVDRLGGLDPHAPSDYGRTFHALLSATARPRGRGALLVVLGDGRTNRFDPLGWAFDELAAGCGGVLWLVPEPLALWGTGDSALDEYLRYVDVAVEARDVAGLARGVAELLRRI